MSDPKHLYPRGGRATERAAAEAIFPLLNELQQKVLAYAKGRYPETFTHIDVSEALGDPTKSTYRTRVAELGQKGMIEDTQATRTYPGSPRQHTLWRYRREMPDAPPPPVIGRKRLEQGDLFGEWSNKRPRSGDGRHVKLKDGGDERIVVPGMASYAGEGPANKYCQDCHWFGSVLLRRPDGDTVEHASEACAQWAKRMGHAAPQSRRRNIGHCASCKHFRDAQDQFRAFRISAAGDLEEQ
jgi:hypothetical protein